MSNDLVLDQLSLTYARSTRPAVEALSLHVAECELVALVGSSGSGKTSLLRLVAGLARPTNGSIRFGEEILADNERFVPPHQRRIGLVSQGADLFPHLNVARNISYGLRSWARKQRRNRVAELLDQVGLPGLENRLPAELSGGEAQRVALARALAPRPRFLLLDEPFSNLDADLRSRLRSLTSSLLREEKTGAIFVTHHGDDALCIGDRVAVMEQGQLVQVGSPRDVWHHPASASVGALFGAVNELPTIDGSSARLARPAELQLSTDQAGCFASGTVMRIEYLGGSCRVYLTLDDGRECSVEAEASPPVTVGSRVGIRWKEGCGEPDA